ncbi:putative quinol monooxygenase [Cognatitamlana onchidii]|uniref:putative quinol monooxygenase n=1 Tax=Cognatitamlana onchidii TaxID=2562860 RepID=UPI0010A648DB|nr:putative quinol monooxygenase [Algibacter onchidii]
MKKVVIVQVSVKETKIEYFLKLAKNMVNESISESECLTYKLAKDLDNKNEFLFYEKYNNEKAVEKHNSSEHFKNFINSVVPLLTKEPLIESFDVQE